MNKTYLIFKHEFLLAIRRPGFIILTLVVPVMALLGIGIIKLVSSLSDTPANEITVIGYVDEVGIFDSQTTEGFDRLVPFSSVEGAGEALARQEISEFIIIPSDYTSSGVIKRYTLQKEPQTPPVTEVYIKSFLTASLLKERVPSQIISLILSPINLEVSRITEQGEIAIEKRNVGNIIIPALFSLLLSLALMFGATSLISGLGEEKESRLIEVLFSSVSIRQLLLGKILALGIAGLLQVLVWLISAPLILNLASSSFGGFMSNIQLPANFLILGVIYFILGYLLFAVLSIGIGAISPSAREGSQLSMFYVMLGFVPLWFSSLLMAFPNSSIWVFLSIFPITAPVQTMLRLGVSTIPAWQIFASIGVLVISIVGGLLLSIKVFRMHMLMHGKRPGIAEIRLNLKNA
jgi:ABC-2 type transport system permease protein